FRASAPPPMPRARRWSVPWPNTSSSASADPGLRCDCVADSRKSFYAGRTVRSEPRNLSDEADLYAAALRALMRRAHSTFELRIHLERRAVEPATVRRVLARLKQEKLL